MHERGKRSPDKKLDSNDRWNGGSWIPTVYRRDGLGTSANLYSHDRNSWLYRNYFYTEELSHSIAIITVSAFGFGAGIAIFCERVFS